MTPPLLTRTRRYRIVAGVDLSEYSDIVIEHALDQAARHESPELHFISVREKRRPDSEDVKRELWDRVAPALQTFNEHGLDWRARLHIRRGKPDEQIASLANEIKADLVVIGQFGLHRKKVPDAVLHQAQCPTLVVGLPHEASVSPQCPMCVTVREASDGERWFCAAHVGDANNDHVMTPMTKWSRGELVWG